MSSELLTFLKYIFLAALYLFLARVLRAVWIELREPRTAAPGAPLPAQAQAQAPVPPPPAWGVPRAEGGRPSRVERLVFVEPAHLKGTGFDLTGELTVGRAPGCGVSLPDDTFVSQLHARVFSRDGNWYVEDLGSTNGTFLNRTQIRGPSPIRRGDELTVGKTTLELAK
jgi:hypothetical protein